MLVTAKEMLEKARDGKYAVGHFNINNLEWTKAILQTAEELRSPVSALMPDSPPSCSTVLITRSKRTLKRQKN